MAGEHTANRRVHRSIPAYDMPLPMGNDDHYLQPYREAHEDHGADFKVTLWANERSQQLRFRVMTEMVFMVGKRVLDAGCSRGDFAAYLMSKDIAYGSYTGLDAVEPVIDYANSRGLERAAFIAGDFVSDASLLSIDQPQVITVSGTLNTMDDDTAVGLLETAWQAAGETLVFNFLSDRASGQAPSQTAPARRLPALKLLDWAMQQTPSVCLRQDYFRFGHDATIAMRKR